MRTNRYVSYLAAEIEPASIQNIKKFDKQTTQVFEKLDRLKNNSAIGGIGAGAGKSTAALARQNTLLDRSTKSLGVTSIAARQLAADTSIMSTALTRAGSALQVVQGPLGPLAGRLTALGGIFRSLAGFSLFSVLAGGGAFGLGSVASQYQNVADRLKPLYENQQLANQAMKEVAGIAARTRQGLAPVAEIYSKITVAARDAGIEQSRNAGIIETVAKAARLSGGTAQSQEAGLTQFSQGFGSGRLAGEELKSVRENTFRLSKAIADGLDVPLSRLRELGAEGQLTPEVIAIAMERSAAQIDLEFSRLPPRIGSSLTKAANEFSIFVGKIDEFTGTTTGIATVIDDLGGNLETTFAVITAGVLAFNGRAIVGFLDRTGGGITALTQKTRELFEANRFQAEQQRAGNLLYGTQAQRLNASANAIGRNVTSLKQQATTYQQNLTLLKAQEAQERQSLNTARTLQAARNATSTDQIAKTRAVAGAEAQLNATRIARIRQEQLLTATTAQLSAAQTRHAAATAAATAAQTVHLGAVNSLIARYPALTAAVTIATAAKNTLLTGLSSLVTFMGGPLGVAMAATAGAFIYLSGQTDIASEAAERFSAKQAQMSDQIGLTTRQIEIQSAKTRELRVELAKTGLLEAKQKLKKGSQQASGSLRTAAKNIGRDGFFDTIKPNFLLNDQEKSDRKFLKQAADILESGRALDEKTRARILNINRNNETAFSTDILAATGPLFGPLGDERADKAVKRTNGVNQLVDDVKEAKKDLKEAFDFKLPDAPTFGAAPTKKDLLALAEQRAAVTDLQKAEAKLKDLRNKDISEIESTDKHVDEIVAQMKVVESLKSSQKAAGSQRVAASKAAKAATAAETAELRKLAEQEAALEKARDKRRGLDNLLAGFEDAPSELQKVEKAKRQVADLIGESVDGFGVFSKSDFNNIADGLEQSLQRPIEDIIKAEERQLQINELVLAGREDEADLLSIKFDLLDRIGKVSDEDLDRIAQVRENNDIINQQLFRRAQLVELYSQTAGRVSDSFEDLIADGLSGSPVRAFANFFDTLKNTYIEGLAQDIRIKLLGDPAQRARDEMTQSLDGAAANLDISAVSLSDAAIKLSDAAASQSGDSPVGIDSPTDVLEENLSFEESMNQFFDGLDKGVDQFQEKINDFDPNNPEFISVIGPKKPLDESLPESFEDVFKKQIRDLGNSVFGGNGKFDKLLNTFSDQIKFQAFGQVGGGFADTLGSITGLQTSKFGQTIGAGIGGAIGGPLGSAVGGFFGSLAGGLFKSRPNSAAQVTGVDNDLNITGSSANLRAQANSLGQSVQNGVANIAEQLGGTVGRFNTSIGTYKGDFRVSTIGRTGSLKGKYDDVTGFEDDEEAAVRFAILDAISDGAVQGIRDSTERLLRAGSDLDAALSRALTFEDVFTRLRRFQDPVAAAVEELNREFEGLQDLFADAGASAQEYADLEELYGFERAQAIEQASNSAVSALESFITDLTAGSSSPLSRRDTYENAAQEVDEFRDDINSGRAVDENDLIEALSNLQDASRELFGSRSSFFEDYDDILALARNASDNRTSSLSETSELPPSPFESDSFAVQQSQLSQLNLQTTYLQNISRYLNPSNLGFGGGFGTALNLLPSSNLSLQ